MLTRNWDYVRVSRVLADEVYLTYHIANILSATSQCVGLTFIIDTDQERLLANIASVILGVLTVGELVDMGLLAMRVLLLGLLAMRVMLLGLLVLLLVLLVLLRLALPIRILPRTHLDNCDSRTVEEKLASEADCLVLS